MRLALLMLIAAACSPDGKGPGIEVDRAMAHVDALTKIGPRPHDSEAARAAASYIEHQLQALELTVERLPVGTVELPSIEVLGTIRRVAHSVTVSDPNLVVRFGPAGKALLFMAHYDTVPDSSGAVDNAASVAILLELARVFAEEKPAQSVMVVFTAGEEVGLAGAEALAAQRGGDVSFAIALDLIGGDGRLTLNGASELIGRAEMQWLADAADRAGVALSVPVAHRVISRWWPQAERSDHGPFTRRGVRAIHFYNRGNDGEWIDLAYHSADDVPARIDRESLDETARILRALTSLPLPEPRGDAFWIPLATNTSIPVWLLIALEITLALSAIAALVTSREGLLRWLRDREPVRGAGLLVGIACYAGAVGAAVGVEIYLRGDHPAPWLHDPLPSLIATALFVLGMFGLLALAVGRFVPWFGMRRYRALGALVPLVIGIALIVIGAPELAWIWLLPAAVIAAAPPAIATIASALPLVLVLHPFQLREAAWNGFLPVSLPLSAWVAIVAIPLIATVAWWIRRLELRLRGTLVVTVGCGLAVIAAIVLGLMLEPECSAAHFDALHLACER